MLEPSEPITLKVRYTPYPAVKLQSDEGRALRPGSVILRHRYLKRQFTIIPSGSRGLAPPVTSLPAAVLPSAAPPTVTFPADVARTAAASVTIHSTTSRSVGAIPLGAKSSVVPSPVVTAALAPVHPLAARAADNTCDIAAPSAANPLHPPLIAALGSSSDRRVDCPGKQGAFPPVQPLPVHARRNTARSHEIVETSNSNLVVRRGQRAIRDKKGQTTWFYSDGQTYLLEPPAFAGARLGDLFVHTAANRDQQIWIFNLNSQWEKIQLYHPHPVLAGYVLHRLADGEPRWIHKTTVTTYKGREKRNQQMYSRSDAQFALATSSSQVADVPL